MNNFIYIDVYVWSPCSIYFIYWALRGWDVVLVLWDWKPVRRNVLMIELTEIYILLYLGVFLPKLRFFISQVMSGR